MSRSRRAIAASALIAAAVVAPVTAAQATSPTVVPLTIPSALAFELLGHVCSPPQEYVTAEGFDPTTDFPTANVYMLTACGGSGRGGHGPTYTTTVGATWDDAGQVYAIGPVLPTVGTGPGFTAFDAYGNEEYQSVSSSFLQWAPGFVPVPRVTGLSLTEGSTVGGQTITVSGSGFTNATAVAVGTVSVPFTVVNDTTLTLVTPANLVAAATAVDITVSSGQGTSLTSSADQFTYTPPQVSGLSPSDGPATGGTAVTITGVGFLGATGVNFGSLPAASFSVVSDTTITATAPADPGLTADTPTDVTVTSAAGTSAATAADTYTFAVPPTISGVSPSSGPLIGGTTITITGANLAYATGLVIGETPVYFWYNPDGSISAQTPAGDAFQAVPVTLTTDGGTNAHGRSSQFTYVQGTPTITLSPSSGPLGTTVIVSGDSFWPNEHVTVSYTGRTRTIVLCRITTSAFGQFGCGGPALPAGAGPLGVHTVTATGHHGAAPHVVTDTATALFTVT